MMDPIPPLAAPAPFITLNVHQQNHWYTSKEYHLGAGGRVERGFQSGSVTPTRYSLRFSAQLCHWVGGRGGKDWVIGQYPTGQVLTSYGSIQDAACGIPYSTAYQIV